MRKILVTGGTVFVSKYVAEYYAGCGDEVYVLNRNTKKQPDNTTLIEADRMQLGDRLKDYRFDAVLDITAYKREDISALCEALGDFGTYIMISSSAVYPETLPQPFTEDMAVGENCFWGAYGTDKIAAEQELLERVPEAYILRPPYLYGPGNDVYREAFVFDCAMAKREFYLPKEGELPLQFFHVKDLCRFMDCILEKKPSQHIFNVGNPECVSVREWVQLCYETVGEPCRMRPVHEEINQRKYLSFYDYAYRLDVSKQTELLSDTKPLKEGLKEAYDWYREHQQEVEKRDYMGYIDAHLKKEF